LKSRNLFGCEGVIFFKTRKNGGCFRHGDLLVIIDNFYLI